jgi:mannose/fructose/N-acetylgalactosamine-specific phosphotransferase system component IIC
MVDHVVGGVFATKLLVSLNVSHVFQNVRLASPAASMGQVLIVSLRHAFEIVVFHARTTLHSSCTKTDRDGRR